LSTLAVGLILTGEYAGEAAMRLIRVGRAAAAGLAPADRLPECEAKRLAVKA
jgi:hypothetical protein